MAERLSTGFADGLNTVGDVKTLMTNSVIHIFSGSQPTSADDVETGDLLMILTVDGGAFVPGAPGNGLNMGVSASGVLAKAVAETWNGIGSALAGAGTIAGYFRWYDNSVTTGASTTSVRVDGAIGTSSTYEMQMSNTTIVEDGPSTVSTFNYTTSQT